MKVRDDFVSNSSSASFVLKFKWHNDIREKYEASAFDLFSKDYDELNECITSVTEEGDIYIITMEHHVSMYNNFHDFSYVMTQIWMHLQYYHPDRILYVNVEGED